jgi:ubiquinone/menaquinone biosynthesis C-methylase UbiE
VAIDAGVDRYSDQLIKTGRLTEPAIRQAIAALRLPPGSCGLDAGCGAGQKTSWLAEAVSPGGRVVGLDQSGGMLEVARRSTAESSLAEAVEFQQGDLLHLPFADAAFDWSWCLDTLWPGSEGRGFADVAAVVAELVRVVKPGGIVALLFWSGQAFLPGYPGLEARLMQAFTESAFYLRVAEPARHYLRALEWLRAAGLADRQARTFAADACAPLPAEVTQARHVCLDMFFGDLESRVSAEDWEQYQRLSRPESADCIFACPDYYFFITYSLFYGRRV